MYGEVEGEGRGILVRITHARVIDHYSRILTMSGLNVMSGSRRLRLRFLRVKPAAIY